MAGCNEGEGELVAPVGLLVVVVPTAAVPGFSVGATLLIGVGATVVLGAAVVVFAGVGALTGVPVVVFAGTGVGAATGLPAVVLAGARVGATIVDGAGAVAVGARSPTPKWEHSLGTPGHVTKLIPGQARSAVAAAAQVNDANGANCDGQVGGACSNE